MVRSHIKCSNLDSWLHNILYRILLCIFLSCRGQYINLLHITRSYLSNKARTIYNKENYEFEYFLNHKKKFNWNIKR